jgi:hypothetical protein
MANPEHLAILKQGSGNGISGDGTVFKCVQPSAGRNRCDSNLSSLKIATPPPIQLLRSLPKTF